MYRDHTVGVVVPAYNEEGFVGTVIESIPPYVDRIYAIDDRSTDGTWAEIRASADAHRDSPATDARSPPSSEAADGSDPNRDSLEVTGVTTDGGTAATTGRVVAIRHEENRGVGGAIKTGYQHARDDGMDATVVVGGDDQMDPEYMDRLLDPIVEGRADYVKGNRLLEAEHHDEMPDHRQFGNGLLTYLTKIATGYWHVGDPQMGYTAISGEALEGAAIDDMYEYYGYCNDLLVRLSTAGYRVADVPCPLNYGDEESHISYREYVPRVSAMLLRSFLRRLWSGKGSPSGAARLGLFVGGAVLTAAGLLGAVASGLLGGTGGGEPRSDASDADRSGVDGGSERTSSSGGCRSTLAVVTGVASLVGAMLLDSTTNAPNNYTEHPSRDD